ncbi:MAG: TRAP transporter TatT component family protein [Treponema sp.]|nr:TRAP transporter TatT component family protein [Treponema sp.]
MKEVKKAVVQAVCVLSFILVSCTSIKSAAFNSASTTLSGADKKGIPVKKDISASDPMLALTGESDVTLISDFFPTALELYEIMHRTNPDHLGLTAMTGSLNVMYANVFIQTPADELTNAEFDRQQAEYDRAKLHYLRGRDYCLESLNGRHKGFRNVVLGTDAAATDTAVAALDKNDVNTAYWACAGWLGAFSLDPLNPDMLGSLHSPAAILEKIVALDPDYNSGAAWDMLCNFYVSVPSDFGGNHERGMYCYNEALRVSGGKTPGPYITYAESVCVPSGDEAGFEKALNTALSLNPDDNPSSRLMTIISQRKARRLLAHKSDYFLHW